MTKSSIHDTAIVGSAAAALKSEPGDAADPDTGRALAGRELAAAGTRRARALAPFVVGAKGLALRLARRARAEQSEHRDPTPLDSLPGGRELAFIAV